MDAEDVYRWVHSRESMRSDVSRNIRRNAQAVSGLPDH